MLFAVLKGCVIAQQGQGQQDFYLTLACVSISDPVHDEDALEIPSASVDQTLEPPLIGIPF